MARSGHLPSVGRFARAATSGLSPCPHARPDSAVRASARRPRERCTMRLIIGIVVVAWLVVGAVAAAQRGYFESDRAVGCNFAATAGLTVLAGPLNYLGVDPRVSCE